MENISGVLQTFDTVVLQFNVVNSNNRCYEHGCIGEGDEVLQELLNMHTFFGICIPKDKETTTWKDTLYDLNMTDVAFAVSKLVIKSINGVECLVATIDILNTPQGRALHNMFKREPQLRHNFRTIVDLDDSDDSTEILTRENVLVIKKCKLRRINWFAEPTKLNKDIE